MNSLYVQRMMSGLRASIRDPQPDAAPEPKVRAPRKKKEVIEHIEPESESDSGSESSSYASYESLEEIKKSFKEEPCEFVSPAGIDQTKTKKEAVQYLESKACPRVPKIKRSAKSIKMDNGPPAPAPETAPAKKVRKTKAAAAPAPAPTPAVALAAPVVAPVVAPAAAAPEKKKRAPSEYAKLVGSYMKGKKMTMAEASKAAKAELDKKKKA